MHWPLLLATTGLLVLASCGNVVELIHRTKTYVLHMEEDQSDSGKLFFSMETSLRHLDLVTGEETMISGHATEKGYKEGSGSETRFNQLNGFIQINSTHFIAVDSFNHCLRMIDRHGRTSQYIGTCNRLSGLGTLGKFSATEITSPWGITRCGANYYVIDHTGDSVIKLDPGKRESSKLAEDSRLSFPRYVVFDKECKVALVTFNHGILEINVENGVSKLLTSSNKDSYGFQDGPLSTSRFHNPVEILALNAELMVVVDNGNNRLRVIDRELGEVKSVCSGIKAFDFHSETLDQCRLFIPWSIALNSNKSQLYIGDWTGIRRVSTELLIDMFPRDGVFG